MPDVIKIALVGKTGHGKSSTGNTILERPMFAESADARNATKALKLAWARIGDYRYEVYDLPGVLSQSISRDRVNREFESLKRKAGKIDVFIFVFNYECRFTAEEVKAFDEIQIAFGNDFLKNQGMIVVTHRDSCRREAKEKGVSTDDEFEEWCKKSGDKFQNITRMVDKNILLVDNTGFAGKSDYRNNSSENIHKILQKLYEKGKREKKKEIGKLSSNMKNMKI